MTRLLLPESARRYIEQDRIEIAKQYMNLRDELDYWNRELKSVYPNWRVVKAHDQVAPDSPLKAGYYHVILDSPGHPCTVMPVEYPDGSFREMGSHVFDMLAENDMWNDSARRASHERQRRLREAADRQRDREAQDRVTHFNERWKSVNGTQISVPRAVTSART